MAPSYNSGGLQCAVINCSNSYVKLNRWKAGICEIHVDLKREDCPCLVPYQLHSFPRNDDIRQRWLSALNRKDYKPGSGARVCSMHFIDGRPTNINPVPALNLGYVKSVKSGRRVLKRKSQPSRSKCKKVVKTVNAVKNTEEVSNSEVPINKKDEQNDKEGSKHKKVVKPVNAVKNTKEVSNFEVPINKKNEENNKEVRSKNKRKEISIQCVRKHKPTHKNKRVLPNLKWRFNLSSSNFVPEKIEKFTGLKIEMFNCLISILGKKSKPFKCHLDFNQQILLVFFRLKMNIKLSFVAFLFNCSETVASQVFSFWIVKISKELQSLICWIPKENICINLPKKFRDLYPGTTYIIDCIELQIQRPNRHQAKCETYSCYKECNTAKFLIAATPHGYVTFVSPIYGGKCSDKFIIMNSGFLKKLVAGDEVMANCSFRIEKELEQIGVRFNIPTSIFGKIQLANEEVIRIRKISSVRMHIERVFRQLKTFDILKDRIKTTMLPKISEIVITCAALVNLKNAIIKNCD